MIEALFGRYKRWRSHYDDSIWLLYAFVGLLLMILGSALMEIPEHLPK